MTKKSSPLPPGCVLRKANYSDTLNLTQKHLKNLGEMSSIFLVVLLDIFPGILGLLFAFLLQDLSLFFFSVLMLIASPISSLILTWLILSMSSSRYWVIECNGCLVAYTKFTISKEYSSVDSLFVESAWRKKGLASCLIKRVIQEAPKPTYLKPIYLICEKDLVRFYARFGFVSIPGKELPKSLILWRLSLLGNHSSIMRYR